MCCMSAFARETAGWLFGLRLSGDEPIGPRGKGAAGQAIQNLNLICGLPETMGLLFPAMYP